DLTRLRTEQLADLVADPPRRGRPFGAEPRGNQPLAPLAADDFGEPLASRLRQRAERITVEVDQPLAQLETLAKRRKRIGGIERRHIGSEDRFGHASSLRIARTGLAPAPTMRSGNATSSYRPG